MTTQPKITSFGYDASDARGDETPTLSLIISVPDSLVATHLLAHITALTNQYQDVQAQVATAEAAATSAPTKIEVPGVVPTPVVTTPTVATKAAKTKPTATKKTSPPKVADLPAKAAETKTTPVAKAADEPEVGLDPSKVEFPKADNPTVVDAAPETAEPVAAATPAKEEEPAAADPATKAETCPPALATATSMRKVIEWMVDHDYKSVDMIVAKCEEYAPQCHAIARAQSAQGGLVERVPRGLDVVLKARGLKAA